MLIITHKFYLLKLLIGFRIGFLSIINNVFNMSCLKISILNGFNIQIEFSLKYLYSVLLFLKKHSLYLLDILTDITCCEFLGFKFRFLLIYTLLSVKNGGLRLILKIKTQEQSFSVLSVTSIYNSANWSEREIFDFFGLFFLYNKDLRRILLDYGFSGYPLRKDFPLSGFIEVYYDDTIKKITYDNVNLTQEYRIFFFPKSI